MKQTNIPFQTWDIDLLVDYILKFHHRNTRKYGGELLQRLTRLATTHHELESVAAHFRNSMADLDLHCQKEENVLYLTYWRCSTPQRRENSWRPSIAERLSIPSTP